MFEYLGNLRYGILKNILECENRFGLRDISRNLFWDMEYCQPHKQVSYFKCPHCWRNYYLFKSFAHPFLPILKHIQPFDLTFSDHFNRHSSLPGKRKYVFWSLRTIGILCSLEKSREPPHVKTNKMPCAPSQDSISLCIHPVRSVFAVRMKKAWVLSFPLSAQQWLWSDWVDAQADLSLLGAQVISLVLSCSGSNVNFEIRKKCCA